MFIKVKIKLLDIMMNAFFEFLLKGMNDFVEFINRMIFLSELNGNTMKLTVDEG